MCVSNPRCAACTPVANCGIDLISDALPFRRLWNCARIVFDCRMVNGGHNQRTAQMKTILMLTVGLMLAGCGSTENHVRKHGGASMSQYAELPDPGNTVAVDTICACP